jgi:hypothetical protein
MMCKTGFWAKPRGGGGLTYGGGGACVLPAWADPLLLAGGAVRPGRHAVGGALVHGGGRVCSPTPDPCFLGGAATV